MTCSAIYLRVFAVCRIGLKDIVIVSQDLQSSRLTQILMMEKTDYLLTLKGSQSSFPLN